MNEALKSALDWWSQVGVETPEQLPGPLPFIWLDDQWSGRSRGPAGRYGLFGQ